VFSGSKLNQGQRALTQELHYSNTSEYTLRWAEISGGQKPTTCLHRRRQQSSSLLFCRRRSGTALSV
ncbi:Plastin-2, partial [Dissostichus eleginoides]